MKFYYNKHNSPDEAFLISIIKRLNIGFINNDMKVLYDAYFNLAMYLKQTIHETILFIQALNRYVLKDVNSEINLTKLIYNKDSRIHVQLKESTISPFIIEDEEFNYILNEWYMYKNIVEHFNHEKGFVYIVNETEDIKEIIKNIENDLMKYKGEKNKAIVLKAHLLPRFKYFKESIDLL